MPTMAFDIRQLDSLSYDEAEPLLDSYISGAVEQFLSSDIGQDYLQTHPESGGWIDSFIEMAYLYGEVTLPKMTKSDVQQVMEYTLPRKLTLTDPSEADDAIPELVAFWTYLKQEYRLRSAGAIAKYLLSIEDKFRDWMFDPARGGIAKNFMLQGMQAGYDMTTQEGAAAFQAEYNQRLQADPHSVQPLSSPLLAPMTAPPPEVQGMLDQLGIELPAVGEMVNPADLMTLILNAAQGKLEALSEEERVAEPPGPSAFFRSLRAEMIGGTAEGEPSLSEDEEALLQAQQITETEPGSILQDFQSLLDFIGSKGMPVSGKRHLISLKLLGELNQRLRNPLKVDFKRPQQKSYPPLHGLYLLLRATGMANIITKGKQQQLMLNPKAYKSWQQLNPTERYCTLLEAWLVRGHAEMLGEARSGPFTEGDRCFQSWQFIAEKKRSYANYADQDTLSYLPGYHNLALMEMFGLVKVTAGNPTSGKGWRIKQTEALPLGKALMPLVTRAYLQKNMAWPSENDPTIPFNELQPDLQPYFPEWQKSLAVPSQPFRSGRHIFKVSLGKAWRRIAISGDATLEDLSSLILESVNFDSDHLDQFTYTNELGRQVEVQHPYTESRPSTDQVKIGSLPLSVGSVMEYVFDFGDWWEFAVQLESVEPEAEKASQKTKKTKKSKRQPRPPLGAVIEARGKAPRQYPDYDE